MKSFVMLSLCITTYNRFELLVESFIQVIDDARITEIVIGDDGSDNSTYEKIISFCKEYPKIKLFRNEQNVGMGENKKRVIEAASNDWCILFDSDNILESSYIDAYINQHRYPDVIAVPEFAVPQFDYRQFSKWLISKNNIKYCFGMASMFECLLNTCNYVVNKSHYLQVYQPNAEMKGTDTIWFNYLWLRSGRSFFVVPEMQYFHRDHADSGFRKDLNYNMQKAKEIANLIRQL